jgi:hypothetical protein
VSGGVPVFIANEGGPSDTDVEKAEIVPLRDANEFRTEANRPVVTRLCIVDTQLHGTHYEYEQCNDEEDPEVELSVLARTAGFFDEHMAS